MIINNALSPQLLDMAIEVLQWARDFLASENEQMTRPGGGSKVVCPFVAQSIEADNFYLTFRPDVNGYREDHIKEVMRDLILEFTELPPYQEAAKHTKTLLVIFPNIDSTQTYVLDFVHKNLKDEFVDLGLMIGQFHQNCKDASVHNSRFLVSNSSPYPLIAIRHMQFHDIIFLYENERWFKAYNIRFGHKFKDRDKLSEGESYFIAKYDEAIRKYSK